MERKIKLRDIAGYLPYGLKMKFAGTNDIRSDEAKIIKGIKSGESFYPILRPISYLNHPITHNGKEIVPIVELACLFMPNRNWNLYFNNAVCSQRVFGFEYGSFFYELEDIYAHVDNQYKLFDYLHELKIDYRGLIDAGLAISVYDLPENCYE